MKGLKGPVWARKLKAGNVDAELLAKALGRGEDVELVAKLREAEHLEDEEVEGAERLVAEIEALLTRNDLAQLLLEVLTAMERFRWQDLAPRAFEGVVGWSLRPRSCGSGSCRATTATT